MTTVQPHPPAGDPIAPAPWQLTAESWLFPFWTSSATARHHRSPSTTNDSTSAAPTAAQKLGLPPGSFHPLEQIDPSLLDDEHRNSFRGGMGAWLLYRYTDSPVGPYDELIYIAGYFTRPDGKGSTPRITNIYVSTTASVWNGRKNWNIPKHLATFEWSHPASSSHPTVQTITVRHPSDSPLASRPIFSAALQPSRLLPSLPLNTALPLFPSLSLVQPPLCSASHAYAATSPRLASAAVGTEREAWKEVKPTFRGRVALAYARPLLETDAFGDGEGFPQARGTWSVGVRFREVVVRFPEVEGRGAGARGEVG